MEDYISGFKGTALDMQIVRNCALYFQICSGMIYTGTLSLVWILIQTLGLLYRAHLK